MPNPPSDFRESRAHWALHWCSVPCPQGVSRCLWQPGSRAVWWSWPWCPALHCLLCTVPCGGINRVFSLSGVRAAFLTSTKSTLQWRESPLPRAQSPSQISSRPLEKQGNFNLEMGFPPGLSHYHGSGGAGSREIAPHILQDGSLWSGWCAAGGLCCPSSPSRSYLGFGGSR